MTSLVHEGRIIRKKKIRDWIVISVKGENEECSKDWTLPRYKYDFLFLGSVVQVTSADPNGKDDVVQDVQLIKVAPDPLAVKTAIGSILAGRLTDASALCLRIEELEELQNSAAANYNFDNVLIKWQSRILKRTQGREERTTPRKRKPHTSRSHLAILCYLENAGSTPGNDWKLVQPVESRSSVAAHIVENSSRSSFNGNSGISSFPLNLPVGLDGQTGRVDYIVDKKGPQIQWIVSRLRTLFLAEKQYCHVVDVGGGRGDLATRIAKEFSFVHVTVVDKNESSLQAGKDYANSLGVADRMSFVPDDFADFRKYNSKVDLVVAL